MPKNPELHNLITSYGGLVIAVISLILSIYAMRDARRLSIDAMRDARQLQEMQNAERVQVQAFVNEDEYWFNGSQIFKNLKVNIMNNSYVGVIISKVDIETDSADYAFDNMLLQNTLPLDIEANTHEDLIFPIIFDLTQGQLDWINQYLLENENSIERENGNIPLRDDVIRTMHSQVMPDNENSATYDGTDTNTSDSNAENHSASEVSASENQVPVAQPMGWVTLALRRAELQREISDKNFEILMLKRSMQQLERQETYEVSYKIAVNSEESDINVVVTTSNEAEFSSSVSVKSYTSIVTQEAVLSAEERAEKEAEIAKELAEKEAEMQELRKILQEEQGELEAMDDAISQEIQNSNIKF